MKDRRRPDARRARALEKLFIAAKQTTRDNECRMDTKSILVSRAESQVFNFWSLDTDSMDILVGFEPFARGALLSWLLEFSHGFSGHFIIKLLSVYNAAKQRNAIQAIFITFKFLHGQGD